MTDTVDQTELAADLARVRDGEEPGKSVYQLIRELEPAMQRALPGIGVTAERFARLATTQIKQTPSLQECDAMSLLGAIMYAAQLGVEPGPLGHAYFVPYKRKATFILGYKGIVALAFRSKLLGSIEARVVRAGDEFDYAYGLDEHLRHVPREVPKGAPAGEQTHFYGLARFTNGGRYWTVLPLSEVLRHRDYSKAKDKAWKTDFDAMGCKTVIRVMAPYLPLSTELSEALATDEMVREFDPDAVGGTRVREEPRVPTEEEPSDIKDAELVGPPCTECDNLIPQGEHVADEYQQVDVDGKPYHAECVPRT